MPRFKEKKRRGHAVGDPKRKIGILAIGVIILAILGVLIWYAISISPVQKGNNEEIEVTIPLGSGSSKIANILKENDVIKNENAFKIYIKIKGDSDFQAGTYTFRKSMGLKEITQILKTGKVEDPSQLNLTYIEGKNIRWLAKMINEKTNNSEEDVYELLENEEYIDSLIEEYWFLTEEIKDESIYYPLEGYLFPDTYALKNKDVTVEEIFKKMLDRTDKILSEYIEKETGSIVIKNKKYSVHKILTMASIIETESMSEQGRKDVASVFYNRLDKHMDLGSDVTTYYAIKVEPSERDLYQKEIDMVNPYNTRAKNMAGKLPIGPIAGSSESSIKATIEPSSTDYLFFVADKNGKLYFTKTNGEHEEKIIELRRQGLWFEY